MKVTTTGYLGETTYMKSNMLMHKYGFKSKCNIHSTTKCTALGEATYMKSNVKCTNMVLNAHITIHHVKENRSNSNPS